MGGRLVGEQGQRRGVSKPCLIAEAHATFHAGDREARAAFPLAVMVVQRRGLAFPPHPALVLGGRNGHLAFVEMSCLLPLFLMLPGPPLGYTGERI